MNKQPVQKNGYYLHYKKKLYRLVDFAADEEEEFVIYQPQYGESVLWQRPKEMFFEDVDLEGKIGPRFTYLGKTIEEARQSLRKMNIQITPEPIIRTSSMLDEKPIACGNYIIRGFATHSESLSTQVLYTALGSNSLLTMPTENFMRMLRK